jgi:hypothetical protein
VEIREIIRVMKSEDRGIKESNKTVKLSYKITPEHISEAEV